MCDVAHPPRVAMRLSRTLHTAFDWKKGAAVTVVETWEPAHARERLRPVSPAPGDRGRALALRRGFRARPERGVQAPPRTRERSCGFCTALPQALDLRVSRPVGLSQGLSRLFRVLEMRGQK